MPAGLTNLTLLDLHQNGLTNLALPAGLVNLTILNLDDNVLTDLTLPGGLIRLTELDLYDNQLTNLTLPAGLTSLTFLYLNDTPLKILVLPQPLAATGLANTVASLIAKGVSVYTYPLAVTLVSPQQTPAGTFGFTVAGPPAVYTILSSTDLATWNQLLTLTNALGAAF